MSSPHLPGSNAPAPQNTPLLAPTVMPAGTPQQASQAASPLVPAAATSAILPPVLVPQSFLTSGRTMVPLPLQSVFSTNTGGTSPAINIGHMGQQPLMPTQITDFYRNALLQQQLQQMGQTSNFVNAQGQRPQQMPVRPGVATPANLAPSAENAAGSSARPRPSMPSPAVPRPSLLVPRPAVPNANVRPSPGLSSQVLSQLSPEEQTILKAYYPKASQCYQVVYQCRAALNKAGLTEEQKHIITARLHAAGTSLRQINTQVPPKVVTLCAAVIQQRLRSQIQGQLLRATSQQQVLAPGTPLQQRPNISTSQRVQGSQVALPPQQHSVGAHLAAQRPPAQVQHTGIGTRPVPTTSGQPAPNAMRGVDPQRVLVAGNTASVDTQAISPSLTLREPTREEAVHSTSVWFTHDVFSDTPMHGTGAGPKVLTFKRAVSPPPLGEEGPAEMIDAAASAQSMALDTVVGKRKLNELVEQIGPDEKLEPEAEEFLLQLADDFIHEVSNRACKAAKHRGATALGVKDLQLELERNWNLRIPGFTSEARPVKNSRPTYTSTHQSRLALVYKQRMIDWRKRTDEQNQETDNTGETVTSTRSAALDRTESVVVS